MPSCSLCSADFSVSDADRDLLDRISPVFNDKTYNLPEPTLCPQCRKQRRLAFYNRRTLYKNTCAHSGKPIISIYHPQSPYTIYEIDVWYSDVWDPFAYGQDFDFERPFFEQFQELMMKVPLPSLLILGGDVNINSDYNNDNYKLKNCYLTFDGDTGEDSMYGESFAGIKDCVDFLFLKDSQVCYECTSCKNCYGLRFSRFCDNCSDSWFVKDCIGCQSCFGCVNLNKQQYHIFNKPYSKEEYTKFIQDFTSGNFDALSAMQQKMEEFFASQPVRATRDIQTENCYGDNLGNCQNAFECFDSNHLQDCRYVSNNLSGGKDLLDLDVWGESSELCYNCCVVGDNIRNCITGYYVSEGGSNIFYSMYCSRGSHNLLGCIGMRHQEYCIFNKQYSKEEYEKLAANIAQHMMKTGEWGEFFPPEISGFGYNETVARDEFPLEEEEVRKRGWKWQHIPYQMDGITKVFDAKLLPSNIADIPDDILNWGLQCVNTTRAYRITKTELQYYRENNLPIPRLHPDERHRQRKKLRNPNTLWKRTCAKCSKDVNSSYSPDRPEVVYCPDCYRAEFF